MEKIRSAYSTRQSARQSLLSLVFLGAWAAFLLGCTTKMDSSGNPTPPEITSASPLTSATEGTAYSNTLTATGGTAPYTWSVSAGSLPGGLMLSPAGALSGTPTATGTFSFTVKVTDAASATATASLQITINPAGLTITTSSLPNGEVNAVYAAALAVTGGTAPYTWSITSGALPTGLNLDPSTGTIGGTPTQGVTGASITFKVTDSSSPNTLAQSKALSLTVFNISVALSPKRGGVTTGQHLPFAATVTNDVGAAGVNWTVSTGGTLASQTTGTASFSAATAGVYTVTATSIADNNKSASATVGVTDLAGVFTYHNDLARDGSNPSEYALTTADVAAATFGKLFSCSVDGAIYAQPLWVPGLTLGGAKRNVVFVATQHESLYAFDADASPCVTLWHVSLIDSNHGGTAGETSVPSGPSGNLVGGGSGDITPEVGVTGTPVINPTGTLYVVSKSVIPSGPTFFQRLHAINILNGNELSGSPVTIAGTYPGMGDGTSTTTFVPGQQNQRPALALVNGVVYITWSSHEDTAPYYGWVMGYNAASLAQTSVLNITPNVGFGGIWMGGSGPAADSSNNLFLITGNGGFDATSASAPNNDYGDSFLKLSTTGGLAISQYFTPSDQASDQSSDQDFGSGGAAVLVDQPSGPVQHLVIGGGKDGFLYLLNRDAMGGLGDSNAWQRFNFGSSIFSTGAFWNGRYYLAGVGGPLQSYTLNTATGQFDLASVPQSPGSFGFPGSTPSVSSSGTTNGIVWALDNGNYCTPQSGGCGPAILHAFDATNVATELWNSTQGTGNTAGNAVKFTVPAIANGKVYVGTRGNNTGGGTGSTSVDGELDVYGLLPN
jgi:putative Ig domain-containing protein